MYKNNGFTLIELVAVLVVLAVVLIITIPNISGVIQRSTKGAFESEARTVIQKIKDKQLEDRYFDPQTITKDNVNNILGIGSENYAQISAKQIDHNIEIVIVGANAWEGLTAYGSSKNMKIVNTGEYEGMAPTITVSGDNPINVGMGTTYADAGATATDSKDGNISISSTVIRDTRGDIVEKVDTSALGTYTITYIAIDSEGNTASAVRKVNIVDKTVPVIIVLGNNPVTMYVGASYSDAGATATDDVDGTLTYKIVTTSNVNPNVAGTYTVTYTVKDKANNQATATRTVNVTDSTAPTVAYGTNGNSTYAKSRSTTVTLSDSESGVNTSSLKYQWTTSTTAPSEGSFSTTFTNGATLSTPAGVTGGYYLWILAKDISSNTAIVRSNIFNLDNTKPVITMNGSSPVTVNVGSSYTDAGATATDSHSGVNGSVAATGTVNVNVIGTYTITYNVNDNAGNTATSVTRTINVVDTVAPTIAYGTNGNTTYANAYSTTVTASDNYSLNASSLKYQWTTSTTAPTEASFSTTFTNGGTLSTPGGVTGSYYLWILAKDTSGNTKISKSNVFNLDNSGPTYTSFTVANVSSSGYDVYLYGVTDTQAGINRVQFPTWTDYNGQDDLPSNWATGATSQGTNQGNGTWYYHVNRTSHNNESGNYSTHIYIWDNAGNVIGFATSGATVLPISVNLSIASYDEITNNFNISFVNTYTSTPATLTYDAGTALFASPTYYDNWAILDLKPINSGINNIQFSLGTWLANTDFLDNFFYILFNDSSSIYFYFKHRSTYSSYHQYLPLPSATNNFVVKNNITGTVTSIGDIIADGYNTYNISVDSSGNLTMTTSAGHTYTTNIGSRKIVSMDFQPTFMWWGNGSTARLDYFNYTY